MRYTQADGAGGFWDRWVAAADHGQPLLRRPALFVGHSGHELCLHGWLSRARPAVFVLTDGSGRSGAPRLAWTTRLLWQCGALPCAPYGRFADADVYGALLHGEYAPLFALVDELAAALVRLQASCLVSDPADGYNPSHDLCRLLAGAALERARQLSGTLLPGYEYRLPTRTCLAQPRWRIGGVRLELSPEEVARKLQAARAFEPLRAEVEAVLLRLGAEVFRTECFLPVADPLALPAPADAPYYETCGEERVADGAYPEVLRHEQHMVPFTEHLFAWLRRAVAWAA
jgi:hypothetical protein